MGAFFAQNTNVFGSEMKKKISYSSENVHYIYNRMYKKQKALNLFSFVLRFLRYSIKKFYDFI